MKKLALAALVMAGLVLPVTTAQALSIGFTPGPLSPFPKGNNILPAPVEGWFGANLYLVGGTSTIQVEFLGFEAGYINAFFLDGNDPGGGADLTVTTTGGFVNNYLTPVPVGSLLVDSGLINFWFTANSGAASVSNGSNGPITAIPNFFVTLGGTLDTVVDGITASSGTVAWIALDDGGAGPDDNHDDLVVKLTIISGPGSFSVPEGGSVLALLGCALAGLGALRRKFSA